MNKLIKISKLISYLAFRWTATGRLEKLWTSKEYEQLISFCDLMLNKNPTDYLAFYYRGLANEMLKRFEVSIQDFDKSGTILETYKRKTLVKEYFIRIPIQISRVYRKLLDNVKALEYADKAVHADNKEVEGLKFRASLKEDFGDFIGASEDLNEALKRRPNDKTLIKLRDRLTYIIIENGKETASR